MNNHNSIQYIYDLIENLDLYKDLDNITDLSYRGNLYEKFIKLLIICNQFKRFSLLNNNYKIITNKENYLKQTKINDSCKDGKIDIKLYNKSTKQLLFLSCKYFTNEKLLKYYELLEMKEYIKNNTNFKKYKLGLCVKNKEEFIKKYNNSRDISNKNLIDLDYVFDYKYFLNILNNFKFNKDMLITKNKPSIKPYDYQQNIINQIKPGNNLIGACPRSGKSYMIGGFITQNKINNVLIITPIIKETKTQWIEDIFNKFSDFNGYNIQNPQTSKELKDLILKDKNIIVISKQLLQENYQTFENKYKDLILKKSDEENEEQETENSEENEAENEVENSEQEEQEETNKQINKLINSINPKINKLKSSYKPFIFNPDLIVFDEHDFHGTSDLSKDIIKTYSKEAKYIIYLTATYFKSLCNISKLNVIKLEYEELRKFKPEYPERIFLTSRLNKKYYDEVEKYLNNTEDNETYDFTELFSINKNHEFNHYAEVIHFVDKYLSGNVKNKNAILNRLTRYIPKKSTQIWFLPQDNIKYISNNLKKILEQNNYYKYYEIACVNSKEKLKDNDLKEYINKLEDNVKHNDKQGLIILAGGMLQRGITLENCAAVFFLNNSESYEKYIQSTYRCLSSSKNKKYGVIVDFNINRILSIVINYSDKNIPSNMPVNDKIKEMINLGLINIDPDYFETYNFNGEQSIKNLEEIWNKNPINQLRIFKKQIEEEYDNIDLIMNKELMKILEELKITDDKTKKSIENETEKITEEFVKDKNIPKQDLKKNKQQILKENENIIKQIEQKKKISKEIIPYIIPLSCILTYNNSENKLIKCLELIKNDETLKDIFNNQCKMIWEKNEFLEFIIKLVNELDINPSNWINNIKYNINLLIDYPDKLTKYINECMIIKSCEVTKHGEVMTPAWLINDILDKFEETDKDIFKKFYTWFDPCAGMGNFHVEIFKRLLKYHKKEYIINKMFYANEINKKNVFLYKMIFGENANINCGDSLKLSNDIKYDIIIGNPPYNSGTKNTGNTIYQEFIKKFINQYNKYFSFINPPGWRKPMNNKCLKQDLYDLMTKQNHLIYLEIHDTKDGQKTFNAGTRYDWFIIDKNINNKNSIIKGIDNKLYNINCNNWLFIPNGNIDIINNIFDFKKINTLNVLYSRTDYDYKKSYVSEIKNNIYKYTLIHSTPKTGPIYKYTSINNKCGFGISKLIFGESGINKIINDKKGQYGLTNGCIGIETTDYTNDEINKIINILESKKFKDFLQSFMFSIFRLEWRIFTYFKKDFYKYFK